MRELEITIDKNGNVNIDVRGIRSNQCLKETKNLENALGIVTERKKKPEFYVKADIATAQRIRK